MALDSWFSAPDVDLALSVQSEPDLPTPKSTIRILIEAAEASVAVMASDNI